MNWIFGILVAASVLTGAFTGAMPRVTEAAIGSAKSAVDLAIGLVGQMALWLGFMGILREGGLMRSIARGLAPLMKRLFPEVPPEHPAMGAMIMNIAANVLGLGNAATPFGLKAMGELNKLNRHPGVATNAMALFLAINTSGVAVLPLGAVAIRATLGSNDAAGIIVPSIIATSLNTIAAVLIVKLLETRRAFSAERAQIAASAEAAAKGPAVSEAAIAEAEQSAPIRPPAPLPRKVGTLLVLLALAYALVRHFQRAAPDAEGWTILRAVFSDWLLPTLMLAIVLFGLARQVKLYETFIQSAKEGFQIAVTIIPFLVAILVAIGMFRASGAMEAIVQVLAPLTAAVGFPAEALPMALVRPLSGSGALGVMTELMKTHGPDSFIGYLVSVMNGSSETTFYVLAVYFGSVGVKSLRHTMAACIAADVIGVVASVAVCHLFFG